MLEVQLRLPFHFKNSSKFYQIVGNPPERERREGGSEGEMQGGEAKAEVTVEAGTKA